MQIRNWLSLIGTAPSRVPRVALARIGREQRWSPSKNDLGALCDYGVRFTRGPKGTFLLYRQLLPWKRKCLRRW